MPRLSFPLKKYINAVEQIAEEKNLRVKTVNKGGSVVRFELFELDSEIPTAFWIVHHEHNEQPTGSRPGYQRQRGCR